MQISFKGQDGIVKAEAQILNGNLWIHFNGQTRMIEPEISGRRKGKSAASSGTEIMAPMPGKVTKILIAKGQSVRKGDALVVMEAMKMEYTLKSDIDSEILEIKCEWGQQVNLGQLLVQMKPLALKPTAEEK